MNNAYIIQLEEKVIALSKELEELGQAIEEEEKRNDGKIQAQNYNCLGTLGENLITLSVKVGSAVRKVGHAKRKFNGEEIQWYEQPIDWNSKLFGGR